MLCSILQVEEGGDGMVLPDDAAMYDRDYVASEGDDYVFSEGDEDDDEHDN